MTDSAPWAVCGACKGKPCTCGAVGAYLCDGCGKYVDEVYSPEQVYYCVTCCPPETQASIEELVEQKRHLVMAMETARKEAREAKEEVDHLRKAAAAWEQQAGEMEKALDEMERERDEWKAKAEECQWAAKANSDTWKQQVADLERENAALQDLRGQLDGPSPVRCLRLGGEVAQIGTGKYQFCENHKRWHYIGERGAYRKARGILRRVEGG